MKPGREVVIAGVGLHPFGRFPEKSSHDLARTAVLEALNDAGVGYKDIQAAYFGHVYYEGMSMGEIVLGQLGLTGIPVINVENACSSGSTGLWLAFWAVATGQFDIVLAFGSEKVPRGPVTTTSSDSPERLIGADFMMASYAQMMRRYMSEYGAPVEAFAQVSVKAHKNASMNPYAHHKKVFTLEDVLNSRMISDPLTLFQCCPTSEGGSAAIICAREVADKYVKDPDRLVTIAGAGLRTSKFGGSDEDDAIASAGREAYEISGVGPQDVDVVQVHDAGTSGELLGIESLKLVDKGQAWKLEMSGDTEIDGSLPVNTDGGLQGMGHPFGATGIRMIHELVTQLNGEAGDRQVKKANIGLAQCSGAGGIATVFLLSK
jgi:acetyl-CoA acetyltransferase